MSRNRKENPEMVPGDRRLMWRMLALCILLLVATVYAVIGVQMNLRRQMELADVDPLTALDNVVAMVRWISLSAGVIFIGFAIWFAWLGTRVLRFGQYPPPGVAVIRDTRIRRGVWAQMLGGLAILYCVFLFLMGTYGAWRFEHAVTTFVKHDIVITKR